MIFANRFKDRVAVVTGGASGIGEATARRIVAEGGRVALFDVNAERLHSVAEDIGATTALIDISHEAQVREAMQQVADEFGRLDIMVNCAGIVGPTNTKITDFSADDFDKVIAINLRGTFLTVKYAVPHMLKNNYGRIMLLSSIGGKDGNPGMVGYAASKSGVMGLVKGIGKEFAATGITVNGLAPAVIATPMNADTAPEMLEYMASKIPAGRLGTVDEAAAIICWVVSEEASFNTGFVFDLSGGRATY
jgi:3-oxoacyl-[acyl-carrier protein] reductase